MYIAVEDLLSNRFRIKGTAGNSAIYFGCTGNPSVVSESNLFKLFSSQQTYDDYTEITIEIPEEASYLVFNFVGTDDLTPSVEYITESVGGTSNYNDLSNKPSINGVTLQGNKTWQDLGLNIEENYRELTSYYDNHYFNISAPAFVGDIVLAPTEASNTKCLILEVANLPSNKFRINGKSTSYIYFTCNNNPVGVDIATFTSLSSHNTGYDNEEIEINIPETASYLVFNFTNTDDFVPKVEVITESIGGNTINYLTSNITLGSSELTLDTGLYYTDDYLVLISSTPVIGNNELIYFDKEKQILWCPYEKYIFDDNENEWGVYQNEHITNEIVNNRAKIPTSQAVYLALQNIGGNFYTEISQNITLNADGTITPALTQGYYHLNSNNHITYYKEDTTTETIYDFSNGIFYYDSSANSLILIINETNFYVDYRITHLSTYWTISSLNSNQIIRNLTGSYSRLATSIPSSGENNFVPNNEAVRNYVDNSFSNFIEAQAGTNNGEFKINSTFAISQNKEYKIKFPTTALTNNAKLSVDNGTTYYNILWEGAMEAPVKSNYLSDKKVTLIYNGTNFIAKDLDTGWFSPSFNSAFSGSTLKARRIGNVVNFAGQIKKDSGDITTSIEGVAYIDDPAFAPCEFTSGVYNVSFLTVGASSTVGKMNYNYTPNNTRLAVNISSITGASNYLRGDITYLAN